MIRPAYPLVVVALALAALLPTGCVPQRPASLSVAAPVDRRVELDAIVAMLDHGDPAAARPRIEALLRRDPGDPDAMLLRRSIEDDPASLLGGRRFAYTARRGETMLGLAQRFLGSRLKAYALARLNGIAVPADLVAGTLLRIPGAPPPMDAGPRPPRRPRRLAAPRRPVVAKPDFAAARQARADGLAALGQGRLTDALVALRRAAMLAPTDPLIQRDLARVQALGGSPRR